MTISEHSANLDLVLEASDRKYLEDKFGAKFPDS
jgi:hypothetical protein